MPTFIVERNLAAEQRMQSDSAESIAAQAQQLGNQHSALQWQMTLVTEAKLYVIYAAPSAEYLRHVAYQHAFTIHRLLQINQQP